MRRSIFVIGMVVLLAACGKKDTLRIDGEFIGLRQADIFVYSTDGSLALIDTIHVIENEFQWETPLTEAATLHLVFPNYSEYVIFAHPRDRIKMKGDATHLLAITIKGNKENEELTTFRLAHLADNDSTRLAAMETYIQEHHQGLVTNYMRRQIAKIKGSASHIETGKKLPPFIIPTDSDTIYLGAGAQKNFHKLKEKKQKSKNLLIFWASWKRDSRNAFNDIRQYSDSSLNIVGISLDNDPNTYAYTVRTDSITWRDYCSRRIWNTPIVEKLQIRELPYYILCDTAWVVKAQGKNWERDIVPSL